MEKENKIRIRPLHHYPLLRFHAARVEGDGWNWGSRTHVISGKYLKGGLHDLLILLIMRSKLST